MNARKTYRLGPTRRTVNRVTTWLAERGWTSREVFVLDTLGQRTGLRRSTPVHVITVGGDQWLVSPYGKVSWVHNVRAHPAVVVRRGRTQLHANAIEETSPDIAGEVLRCYARSVRVTRPFFDTPISGSTADFAAEAPRHPLFHLDVPSAGKT